jgi:hypothetical protein
VKILNGFVLYWEDKEPQLPILLSKIMLNDKRFIYHLTLIDEGSLKALLSGLICPPPSSLSSDLNITINGR